MGQGASFFLLNKELFCRSKKPSMEQRLYFSWYTPLRQQQINFKIQISYTMMQKERETKKTFFVSNMLKRNETELLRNLFT